MHRRTNAMGAFDDFNADDIREQMIDCLREHYIDHFCEGCSACRMEADTGAWICPADGDPFSTACVHWGDNDGKLQDCIDTVEDGFADYVIDCIHSVL